MARHCGHRSRSPVVIPPWASLWNMALGSVQSAVSKMTMCNSQRQHLLTGRCYSEICNSLRLMSSEESMASHTRGCVSPCGLVPKCKHLLPLGSAQLLITFPEKPTHTFGYPIDKIFTVLTSMMTEISMLHKLSGAPLNRDS